tara:strand:- start:628 stop:993 length:366 start_codon:yes stop_codon:yes gene_type:complete
MNQETKLKIDAIVKENNVVLFMKGNAQMPQCGFSSKVAGILNFLEVEYKDINVLQDDSIRQGIKDFSDWPTIPQLYINQDFIGGSDIVIEMTMSGELDQLLSEKEINYNKSAASKIREENS